MRGNENSGNFLNGLEQASKQAASSASVVVIAEQQVQKDQNPDDVAAIVIIVAATFIIAFFLAIPQALSFAAFSFTAISVVHRNDLHHTNCLIHSMQVLFLL